MALPEASPLDWNKGEHVEILDEGGGKALWRVSKRVEKGWLLEEIPTGETRSFSDALILLLRLNERLHHYPANAAFLSERRMDLITTPRTFWPKRLELIVDVKLAYCKFVDERMAAGLQKGDACRAAVVPVNRATVGSSNIIRLGESSVPGADDGALVAEPASESVERSVHAANYAAWWKRLRDIRIGEEAKKTSRALPETAPEDPERDDEAYYDFDAAPWFLRPPYWRTVSNWHTIWVRSGRREGVLQPDDELKGNRKKRVDAIIATKDGAKDVYEIMGKFLEDLHLDMKRVTVSQVWNVIKTAHPEFETYFTSAKPLACLVKKLYPNSYDRQKRSDGAWKANNDHRVSQVHPDPEYVMDELEIDHCLADIVVVNENGNILGRPWITTIMDRCSRMIVGMHVSFEVPSYASVQRCLMHAFWPKDLRRWKPGHPDFDPMHELLHNWPCEGIPDTIYTDRGKEFLSIALDNVGWSLGIRILPLKARCPWLKGKIERFFRTMHAKVYSYEEGKTFRSHVERLEYDPYKKAKVSLRDLKWNLLKWVVDDYHATPHDGLGGIPIVVWHQKVTQKHVRQAPDARYKHAMLGKPYMAPIGRSGVSIEGSVYTDPALERLQRIHGPGHQYHVTIDPFDMGQIWLFPPKEKSPVVIPARQPHLCVGMSLHQTKVHRRLARKLYGTKITPEGVGRVIAEAERQADERMADRSRKGGVASVARFRLANGEFLTPVVGDSGVVARLPSMSSEPEAPASAEVFSSPVPEKASPEVSHPVRNQVFNLREKVAQRLREKEAKKEKAS